MQKNKCNIGKQCLRKSFVHYTKQCSVQKHMLENQSKVLFL